MCQRSRAPPGAEWPDGASQRLDCYFAAFSPARVLDDNARRCGIVEPAHVDVPERQSACRAAGIREAKRLDSGGAVYNGAEEIVRLRDLQRRLERRCRPGLGTRRAGV